jgi:hypothetical protein
MSSPVLSKCPASKMPQGEVLSLRVVLTGADDVKVETCLSSSIEELKQEILVPRQGRTCPY